MNLLFRVLDRVLEMLLFAAMAIMTTVVFVNVCCRFVFDFSLSWGEEIALLTMVWLTYLGAAVATRDRAHFAFDYLVRNLGPRAQYPVILLGHVVFIAATAALLYWSANVTVQISEWVTAALEISQSWVYAACPVGCFFILVYAIRNFVTDTRGSRVGPLEEEARS